MKHITDKSLCFTASWISPITKMRVSAAHFVSFINYNHERYQGGKFVPVRKRF